MSTHGDIIFYAFRYALGRRTYAVNDVATYIINHATEIHARDRETMRREILDAIERGQAGMECDVEDWRRVVDALVRANT